MRVITSSVDRYDDVAEREPLILIHVDSYVWREPETCHEWTDAFQVLARFDDTWQFMVHVGMHDIDIYVLKRFTKQDIRAMTGTF